MTDDQLEQLFQAIRDKIAAGNVGPPGPPGARGIQGIQGIPGVDGGGSRKKLTAATTFNVGVNRLHKTISEVWQDLASNYDLAMQNVTVLLDDDQQHAGFTMYGLLPGQVGPHSFTIRSSNLGRSSIVPHMAHAALELAYGASAKIERLEIDGMIQAAEGHPQDMIMLGQGARLVMGPEIRIKQNSETGYNWISMSEQSSLDVYGNIYVQGAGQCFLTIDMGSCAHWVNNGQPNMLAMFMEAGGGRSKPYWTHSFLNPRGGSVITHQAVDYHGGADGYRYKIDKGGVLDVDLGTYPNGLDRLPGSENTFGSVQGFIF